MGKQRQRHEPPHDVRRATLDAARRLLAERGFDGTSLQDVASVVGVSKQAVLHHFPSKDALREAVLADLLAHWSAVLPRLLLEATGGYRRFTAVFGTLVRFFNDEPSWARLVVREVLDRPEPTRARLQEVVRPWIEAIAESIRIGQTSGALRDDVDPEAWVTEMLQLALVGAAAHPVLAAALQGHGDRRLDAELGRIAAASLFRERPPKGAGRKAR